MNRIKQFFQFVNSVIKLSLKSSDPKLFKNLKDFRDKDGTVFDGYNLEFFGTCKSCKNKQIENTKH